MEKEINVYDLNCPTSFKWLYQLLEYKGVKVNRLEDLPPTNNSLPIIIVPAIPILKEKNTHWDKIKNYIEKSSKTEILFIDYSDARSELENLIGKDKNVEYLMTQETMMNFTYDKVLNKLRVEN
jgi:hypothetical protein